MLLHGNTAETPHWVRRPAYFRPPIPRRMVPWLLDAGSLTRRVVRACPGTMRVQVLREQWGRADAGEAVALSTNRQGRVWLREVLLLCDETPWVYARTVIPTTTLAGPARRLLRLGSRPLGAVLFADPTVVRGEVELARLQPQHRLYRRAARPTSVMPAILWARRSLFWVGSRPLLVAEVFLPSNNGPMSDTPAANPLGLR